MKEQNAEQQREESTGAQLIELFGRPGRRSDKVDAALELVWSATADAAMPTPARLMHAKTLIEAAEEAIRQSAPPAPATTPATIRPAAEEQTAEADDAATLPPLDALNVRAARLMNAARDLRREITGR